MANWKALSRDALPARWQVPLKYAYATARGHLEPEMQLLPHLVSAGDRVCDIGGNRGVYAYRLWKLGARVEVFEPNLDLARILNAWAAGKQTVSVHPVALSSHAGTAQLHIPVGDDGLEHDASASIQAPHTGSSNSYDISTDRIDSFRFTDCRFMKIDVEGHEQDVLDGATDILNTAKPALLIEIEQRHTATPINDIFARIASFGYRGYFLDGRVLRDIGEFDLAKDQAIEVFGSSGRYINNFLFLAGDDIENGTYRELLSTFR